MSGKYCNHLSILIIAICVSPMQMAVGQTGPGGGYAKIPKGAYSIIAEIRLRYRLGRTLASSNRKISDCDRLFQGAPAVLSLVRS